VAAARQGDDENSYTVELVALPAVGAPPLLRRGHTETDRQREAKVTSLERHTVMRVVDNER